MTDFASACVDISEIGLRNEAGDPEFDAFTERLRQRFAVDAVLVSIIDAAGDRQVFKGRTAPNEVWSQARETPLSQSLCKIVAEQGAPLNLPDVEGEIPTATSRAFVDLGVRSYLGTPLFDDQGACIGALCLITTATRRVWTMAEQEDLSLFAATVNEIIAHRQTARKLDRADMALATLNGLPNTQEGLRIITEKLPGATFRFALFDDGSEAIEYLSESCVDIWGYDERTLEGDPNMLWEAVLPQDRDAARASVMQSARTMTVWRHGFRIRRPDGSVRRLCGYGQPEPMEGGVGVMWHSLVLDLDQLAEDAARGMPGAIVSPLKTG